jgi:hypothetical protein
MRNYLRSVSWAAVGLGLLLAACLSAPGEPANSTGSALSCTGSERAFNGSCRAVCTTSAECASPNTCMTVSTGVSLCLDYTSCAYLGSDTECVGVAGGSYGGYSTSDESFDPYWTPSYDPYASSYGSYGSSSASLPFGCGGNAVWHAAPPVATDDPKCGETHAVTRCQKVGSTCALVSGNTIDVAER